MEVYSSALFAYYNDALPADPEYYTKTNTQPISHRVADWFAKTYYTRLYASMSELIDRGDGARAGYELEALGRLALSRGGEFEYRVLGTDALHKMVLPPAYSLELSTELAVDMCTLPSAGTTSSRRTAMVSTDKRFPNIDMADASDRGYNFTVSTTHAIAAESMVAMLEATGASPAHKFLLVWCVPACIFMKFAPGPQALKANRIKVDDQQSDRLEQWVLCLPSALPQEVNSNPTVLQDPVTSSVPTATQEEEKKKKERRKNKKNAKKQGEEQQAPP